MSFGPNPWQQAHWDWRAAGNFMCGGAGSGLIVCSVLAGAQGPALQGLLLGGLALVGLGLSSVWLEIGKPLRALNVFRHPHLSWMSREAIVAALLFPVGLLAVLGVPGLAGLAAALALAFMYCQGRMLRASRGIPAWRESWIVPLILSTAWAEGAGLFLAASPWHGVAGPRYLMAFGLLVLLRLAVWFGYRRRVRGALHPKALAPLERSGDLLQSLGTLAPLVLVAAVVGGAVPGADSGTAPWWAALAGLAAFAGGLRLKFTLITRASFNQGFALVHLPTRGKRR